MGPGLRRDGAREDLATSPFRFLHTLESRASAGMPTVIATGSEQPVEGLAMDLDREAVAQCLGELVGKIGLDASGHLA